MASGGADEFRDKYTEQAISHVKSCLPQRQER
jgi:hypothetical protein